VDIQIIVALIALAGTIGNAIFTWWSSRQNDKFKAEQEQRNLQLQANITAAQAAWQARQDEESAEHAALREYRFEALKRLYTQVQPLLFQMRGALQQARDHALNLARASRDGHLGAGKDSWMRDANYYLPATMYRFMLPAAYQRMMEEHLALVDLSLDPKTSLVYALLGEYLIAWRSDYDIAATLYGPGAYVPVDATENAPRPVPTAPDGQDAWQGLLAGWRDTMVDQLIIEDKTTARPMRFGAFVNALQDESGTVLQAFAPLAEQLQVFDPASRPVQWAILLILASLAELTEWVLAQNTSVDPAVRWAELAHDQAHWDALSFRPNPSDDAVAKGRACVINFMDTALRRAKAAASGRA
jgi:hypothetical protein